MKVIVAGYAKTGTKTMFAALTILGYRTYDYVEHFWYHGNEWNKILNKGGTIDDFKKMYKDVDAVTDHPAFYFWQEIHQAFPDAKIVLMLREEDSWYKSWYNQIEQNNKTYTMKFANWSPYLGWKYFNHFRDCLRVVFGADLHPITGNMPINEMIARMKYRQHNNRVLQFAPKDKLLIYDVRQGWEPLCKFLGKDVPDQKFPHKNIKGAVFDELYQESPIVITAFRRAKIGLFSLIVALVSVALYIWL